MLFSRVLITGICLLCTVQPDAWGQNLVPNPGFEENTGYPEEPGEWNLAKGWTNLNGVHPYAWPYASPDYLHKRAKDPVKLPNSTFATVEPYSGEAVMGQAVWISNAADYREYIATQLFVPLKPGCLYKVSFYITNGRRGNENYSSCGISGFGIYFSKQLPVQEEHEPIEAEPQLRVDSMLFSQQWEYISFYYMADSAYRYMVIGNFRNDSMTRWQHFPDSTYLPWEDGPSSSGDQPAISSYYFLDDVEVKLIESAENPAPDISLFKAAALLSRSGSQPLPEKPGH